MALTQVDQGLLGTYAQYTGFKNRIINGAMAIDQRNAGASVSTAGGTVYTLDRWYVGANGNSATVQQVTGATANQYRLQVTGASGITSAFLVQRIESKNSADLAGQTVTLSFDMANSLLTSVSWNAYYANSTDSFGTLASPTVTSITGGTVAISSAITRYSVSFAVPSAANTGIMIQLSVGAQTSGTWTTGNVQLEKGSTATSFDYRPYGTELALCQRYYFRIAGNSSGTGYASVGNGYSTSTTAAILSIPLPVSLRTTSPTLGFGGTISLANVLTTGTLTGFTTTYTGNGTIWASAAVGGGTLSTNYTLFAYTQNAASNYVDVSAEL